MNRNLFGTSLCAFSFPKKQFQREIRPDTLLIFQSATHYTGGDERLESRVQSEDILALDSRLYALDFQKLLTLFAPGST